LELLSDVSPGHGGGRCRGRQQPYALGRGSFRRCNAGQGCHGVLAGIRSCGCGGRGDGERLAIRPGLVRFAFRGHRLSTSISKLGFQNVLHNTQKGFGWKSRRSGRKGSRGSFRRAEHRRMIALTCVSKGPPAPPDRVGGAAP
jgi:hypothetical protein